MDNDSTASGQYCWGEVGLGLTWLSMGLGAIKPLKRSAWVILYENHCVAAFIPSGDLDFGGVC